MSENPGLVAVGIAEALGRHSLGDVTCLLFGGSGPVDNRKVLLVACQLLWDLATAHGQAVGRPPDEVLAAGQLERVNPDAAASLREGLTDTLTVTRLGVTGSLLKTVMSTNPVESMIEIVRAHARNVKRWQPGDMRLRWAAADMLAAAGQFRRIKGYRQLPLLAQALHHAVSTDDQPTTAVTA